MNLLKVSDFILGNVFYFKCMFEAYLYEFKKTQQLFNCLSVFSTNPNV